MLRKACISSGGVIALVGAMAVVAPTATADTENGNLPGGTSIQVSIDNPPSGTLIASSAASPVTFDGTAAVGEGVPNADTTLISVIDVSGSTASPTGCGGDANGDGSSNTVLDCEVAALIALNDAAIAAGTIDEVGIVAFGSSANDADVDPTATAANLTAPDADVNGNSVPDVEEVIESAFIGGGLGDFTAVNVGFTTNFEAAVQAACGLAQSAGNPNVQVAFLSDGVATAGGGAVDDLPCSPQTATFDTFAVGSASDCTTGGGTNSLKAIAEATGGSCTPVTTSDLPDILPDLIASQLTGLDINVDGGAWSPVSTVSPALPQDGPVGVTWSHDLNLAPGSHTVCVRATGSDKGGTGSVTDCHDVTVATITLTPESETNDLTTETSHTVTATVAAGADGGVSGVMVDFTLGSGPNAPDSGSGTTDAAGQVTFTWTNPNQDPSGLGTDAVQACFDDDLGNTECDDATKEWADLTPPDASCDASVNPSGKAPKGAQPGGVTRSHGFFVLNAIDVIDPDPQIWVRDTGSGHIFGPFADGTNIKWTQGNGPVQKTMGGPNSEVEWHLIGDGDAEVYATDASGNMSASVYCTVPPS